MGRCEGCQTQLWKPFPLICSHGQMCLKSLKCWRCSKWCRIYKALERIFEFTSHSHPPKFISRPRTLRFGQKHLCASGQPTVSSEPRPHGFTLCSYGPRGEMLSNCYCFVLEFGNIQASVCLLCCTESIIIPNRIKMIQYINKYLTPVTIRQCPLNYSEAQRTGWLTGNLPFIDLTGRLHW